MGRKPMATNVRLNIINLFKPGNKTILQIANKAGVSTTTVHTVISNYIKYKRKLK